MSLNSKYTGQHRKVLPDELGIWDDDTDCEVFDPISALE